jgi:hypothetical protein
MSQKNKRGLQRGLSEIIEKQTAPLPDKSRESSDLISRFRDQQAVPPLTQVQQTQVHETRDRQTQVSDPPLPRSISPTAKGFTSIPNHLLDQTLKTLDVYDQSVLLRIYRLSRGFGKDRAEVGVGKLAEATNISEKQIKRCIARLISAGLISKAKTLDGYSNIYICHVPGVDKAGGDQQTQVSQSQVRQTHNKEKLLKENDKKGNELSLNTKSCPDCQGSGFWYPEGLEKGVAKCKHTNLASSERTSPT